MSDAPQDLAENSADKRQKRKKTSPFFSFFLFFQLLRQRYIGRYLCGAMQRLKMLM